MPVIDTETVPEPRPRFLQGLRRGFVRHCPSCGRGPLFRGYLKVAPTCSVCGADNDRYPADDAAPYFTILIVGHLVLAPALGLGYAQVWPTWLSLTVFLPSILLFTLALLPFVKGAVIGASAALGIVRAPGG